MDPDLLLIVCIILAVFSVPSILSAVSEGRAPRVAALSVVAGGALILWAINSNPGGYSFGDIPDIFVRVVARYLT